MLERVGNKDDQVTTKGQAAVQKRQGKKDRCAIVAAFPQCGRKDQINVMNWPIPDPCKLQRKQCRFAILSNPTEKTSSAFFLLHQCLLALMDGRIHVQD